MIYGIVVVSGQFVYPMAAIWVQVRAIYTVHLYCFSAYPLVFVGLLYEHCFWSAIIFIASKHVSSVLHPVASGVRLDSLIFNLDLAFAICQVVCSFPSPHGMVISPVLHSAPGDYCLLPNRPACCWGNAAGWLRCSSNHGA